MTVALVINQIVCAAAALGLMLASYQAATVSASRLQPVPVHVEAPAAQTVNRSAKGDKWESAPEADPESAATPDVPRNPVIIAGRYEVVAATLISAEPSLSDPLLTLRILPEPHS